ncbi:SPOR domain-containing protein [candidate division KSB1 bacterium]|nr:SPOR domain-containing protein [candidate division KSB1 bacterium]
MIRTTCFLKIAFGLLLVLVARHPLLAQSEENALLQLLANNDHAKAKAVVDLIAQRQPGSPKALFFQALVEKNADSAIKLYNDILLLHKNSPYAPKALYKVAQYYFVKGFYFSARKNFLDLIGHYPNLAVRQDASYYAAKCLLMTGKADSARIELQTLLASEPSQDVRELVQDDLDELQEEQQKSARMAAQVVPVKAAPPKEQTAPPKNFTIQVGAFSNIENANSLKSALTKKGFAVEVVRVQVNRRYLYKVYVGRFARQAEAEQFAVAMESKFGLSYRIINLEE